MDRKRDHAMGIVLAVLVAAVAVMAGLLTILPYRYHLSGEVNFEESERIIKNPLTGFAMEAKEEEDTGDNLVYIGITWAEWEPREGFYDIAGLEKKYQISRWKKAGKHAVLRFICDYPRSESHMDIPQWLYDRTGDGVFYDMEYGRGYCPNYENAVFLERHRAAVQALAGYCNRDDFVSYVELGSLGHWGEWHVKTGEGLPGMPREEYCRQYVNHYTDSFYEAKMLTRRSYEITVDEGLGIYNDMTGSKNDTEEWLKWTEGEGAYETGKVKLPYKANPEFWNHAPVGGEFTSSIPMETMLTEQKDETLDLVRRSHMTFIGPKCPSGKQRSWEGALEVERELGYRLWISSMKPTYRYLKNQIEISLAWENTGAAPLYWNWSVMMYVYDRDGKLQYWEAVDLKLQDLTPGKQIVTVNRIPFNDLFRQGYSVGVGVVDPLTEKPAVELAMDVEYQDGINMLYVYEKE